MIKIRHLIWFFCLLILVQIGWTGWRLCGLKVREKENLRLQEEKKAEQREQIIEELKKVPEPKIEPGFND